MKLPFFFLLAAHKSVCHPQSSETNTLLSSDFYKDSTMKTAGAPELNPVERHSAQELSVTRSNWAQHKTSCPLNRIQTTLERFYYILLLLLPSSSVFSVFSNCLQTCIRYLESNSWIRFTGSLIPVRIFFFRQSYDKMIGWWMWGPQCSLGFSNPMTHHCARIRPLFTRITFAAWLTCPS